MNKEKSASALKSSPLAEKKLATKSCRWTKKPVEPLMGKWSGTKSLFRLRLELPELVRTDADVTLALSPWHSLGPTACDEAHPR